MLSAGGSGHYLLCYWLQVGSRQPQNKLHTVRVGGAGAGGPGPGPRPGFVCMSLHQIALHDQLIYHIQPLVPTVPPAGPGHFPHRQLHRPARNPRDPITRGLRVHPALSAARPCSQAHSRGAAAAPLRQHVCGRRARSGWAHRGLGARGKASEHVQHSGECTCALSDRRSWECLQTLE